MDRWCISPPSEPRFQSPGLFGAELGGGKAEGGGRGFPPPHPQALWDPPRDFVSVLWETLSEQPPRPPPPSLPPLEAETLRFEIQKPGLKSWLDHSLPV